jgi:predicted nucleotidyltransferase
MTASRFTSDQVEALRDLDALWGRDSIVLVGASALACSIDMSWRATRDLDISVAISIDDYPGGLSDLPGWTPHPKLEHEWLSPRGVPIDVFPAGDEHLRAGFITWPKSGFRMSLIGIRLAFLHSKRVPMADDFEVPVAPASVITVLKMAAYLDRPADRLKDLSDIGHVLEEYIAEDDDRRYSTEVLDRELAFEDVSAFLLGRDVGAVVQEAERQVVDAFLARVCSEGDRAATQARMLQRGPRSWRADPQVLASRLEAFELGLGT